MVKKPPVNVGDMGLNPVGQEDPLEKEMATQSSIIAWKVLWTEKPDGLVHGVAELDATERLSTHTIAL